MTTPVITKLIEQVVTSMRGEPELTTAMLPNDRTTLDQIPFYLPGHKLEIENRLKQMAKDSVNKWNKYPLIALKLDTPAPLVGDYYQYNLNLVIVAETEKNYNAQQRIDEVFIPVLYPLYELFLKKLYDSGLFSWDIKNLEKPPHVMIERPYYGVVTENKNTANVFSDTLDAIEILNLRINAKNKC